MTALTLAARPWTGSERLYFYRQPDELVCGTGLICSHTNYELFGSKKREFEQFVADFPVGFWKETDPVICFHEDCGLLSFDRQEIVQRFPAKLGINDSGYREDTESLSFFFRVFGKETIVRVYEKEKLNEHIKAAKAGIRIPSEGGIWLIKDGEPCRIVLPGQEIRGFFRFVETDRYIFCSPAGVQMGKSKTKKEWADSLRNINAKIRP